MAIRKFSQITLASTTPGPADYVVGVTAGNIDLRYTLAQVGSAIIAAADKEVLYDKAGVVSGDANLVWDYTNKFMGIGLSNPGFSLDVNGIIGVKNISGIYVVPNGSGNNFFEGNAGNTGVSGANNYGTGDGALANLTIGGSNLAIGANAMRAAVDASQNVAIGSGCLGNSISDSFNVAIGAGAGAVNGAGAAGFNVFIGSAAGQGVTLGSANVLIGFSAGTITTGSQNIIIGFECDVPSFSSNGQISIGNMIYGTGCTAFGSTISSGWIGIGVRAAYTTEVFGVNGTICTNAAAFMMRTATSYTDGAGTGSGVTFTNAPGSSVSTGNPTKWIPVDDHGTTRYIPAF
jgi:hypothetical protein